MIAPTRAILAQTILAAVCLSSTAQATPDYVVVRPEDDADAANNRKRRLDPGKPRTHDGLMLRLAIGGGYGVINEAIELSALPDGKLSGALGLASLDIGGGIARNLSFHGRFSHFSMVSPTVEIGGQRFDGEGTLRRNLIGVGLNYYSPENIYIVVTGGLAFFTADTAGREPDMNPGYGLEFDLGKEWWVSDHWGLGGAARLGYAKASHEDLDATLGGWTYGAVLSATWN